MNINSRIKRFISILLVSSLLFVQPSIVKASESLNDKSNNYIFEDIVYNCDVQQVFDNLTIDAKEIFLDYLINNDQNLYEYHNKNVIESDEDLNLIDQLTRNANNVKYTQRSNNLIMPANSLTNSLDVLKSYLNQIQGLTDTVIYALMAAGSTIVADIASLGTAKIATILLGGACLVILLANWSVVEAAWPEIVNAFKKAFGGSISTTTIQSDFSIAKLRVQQDYIKNRDARAMALNCGTTASCANHITIADAMQILRRGRTIAIYSSHYEDTGMIVISIPRDTTASISRNLSSRQLQVKDVSLGKLYVLFNLKTNKYFHMHVSLFGDDTHYLRNANGLCYQLSPTFSYDPEYDHPRRPLSMPLNNNW